MNDKPGHHWDAAQASAWAKWFHVMEAAAGPLSERMIELSAIGPGHRVLDIATGLGEPAVRAARRVGPSGLVLATDISPDMLAFARRRAEELGLGNIEFREMDAEAPELADGAFDAALCRWGLMFVRDLAGVLAGIRRCLEPGGRFVAAVWGPAEQVPVIALGARVIHAHLGLPPPEEGAHTPFALSDVAALRRQVEAAGFSEVGGEWMSVEFVFGSAEEFTRFRRERSGPLITQIAEFPAAAQEAAWRALSEAARDFEAPDGSLRLANRAYCLAARR